MRAYHGLISTAVSQARVEGHGLPTGILALRIFGRRLAGPGGQLIACAATCLLLTGNTFGAVKGRNYRK
jgi:tetrahydromethanopterin S-methyltransferase subunit D